LIHPPGNGDRHKPEWVEDSFDLQRPLSQGRPATKAGDQDRRPRPATDETFSRFRESSRPAKGVRNRAPAKTISQTTTFYSVSLQRIPPRPPRQPLAFVPAWSQVGNALSGKPWPTCRVPPGRKYQTNPFWAPTQRKGNHLHPSPYEAAPPRKLALAPGLATFKTLKRLASFRRFGIPALRGRTSQQG
jgi:hypothetical protein